MAGPASVLLPASGTVLMAVVAIGTSVQDRRTPFAEAIPVREAAAASSCEVLVCGEAFGVRLPGAESRDTTLILIDPDTRTHTLDVTWTSEYRRRFASFLEQHLMLRQVCVTGTVRMTGSRPSLAVSRSDQVRFVGAPPAPMGDFVTAAWPGTPGLTEARPLITPTPEYPGAALPARMQGIVVLQAVVGADGRVKAARIVRSVDPILGLDDAALLGAMRWVFAPATQGGLAVASVVTIVQEFRAEEHPGDRPSALPLITQATEVDVRPAFVTPDDPFLDGVSASAGARPPRLQQYAMPHFPFDALRAGLEGTVTLDVVVAATGEVARARVAGLPDGAIPEMGAAAVRAVGSWVFAPGRALGTPTPMRVEVDVPFRFRTPQDVLDEIR